jgi:hypothetical protein
MPASGAFVGIGVGVAAGVKVGIGVEVAIKLETAEQANMLTVNADREMANILFIFIIFPL